MKAELSSFCFSCSEILVIAYHVLLSFRPCTKEELMDAPFSSFQSNHRYQMILFIYAQVKEKAFSRLAIQTLPYFSVA